MVTSDKLKIFFPFFLVFFFCFNFFPKIHLCTNNWHRRETFGYAVGWVSQGEKEKNKMLPRFLGVRAAPGPGSSIHRGQSWSGTANLARAWCQCPGFPSHGSPPPIQAFHEVFPQGCSPSLLPWRFSPFPGDMGDGMVGFPNSGGAGPQRHCAQGDKIPKSHR